jgi:hypothetical protein
VFAVKDATHTNHNNAFAGLSEPELAQERCWSGMILAGLVPRLPRFSLNRSQRHPGGGNLVLA